MTPRVLQNSEKHYMKPSIPQLQNATKLQILNNHRVILHNKAIFTDHSEYYF